MPNVEPWIDELYEQIKRKMIRGAAQAAQANVIPYKGNMKTWEASPYDGNSWWTGGFWPAMMWQLYAESRDERFLTEARRAEGLLTRELRTFDALNHDVGFMYLLSCGASYKLTGNEQSKTDCLHAATLLAGRFNPHGFIRAWNGGNNTGWAIVDCMMNLSLLYWASRVTGDPRFRQIAEIHADTTRRCFVRPDGSCNHIVVFDPDTGDMLETLAGQGAYVGSSWSRGQAWALYGFTLAAMNGHRPEDLDTAKRVAHYFIANIRPDGLAACDFRQPKDAEGRDVMDNIAGACAACGLIELSRLVPEGERDLYLTAAMKLLRGMRDHCCCLTDDKLGILTACTAAYHDQGAGFHENIVYGDYFLLEALCKLRGTDPMLWQ